MLPGPQDLTMQQGDDFTFVFRIRQKVWDEGTGTYVPGPYQNLTGFTGASQMRPAPGDPVVLADFTVTPDPDQVNNTGIVIMTLDSAVTTTLDPTPTVAERYYWDVQLIDAGGKISTYLSGRVNVLPEVTRAP